MAEPSPRAKRPEPRAAPPRAKIAVLVVDDHPVLRAGLRMLINGQPDMEVVGETGDGGTATALATELKPDVAIVDLSIPGAGGMATSEEIRRASPGTQILVLTVQDDLAYARTALARGATGYVVKDADTEELLAAIRAVHRGRIFVYLGGAGPSDQLDAERAVAKDNRVAPESTLSSRERRVLVLVAHGYTSRQIGQMLSLSAKTVETYRGRINTKLGLRTRSDYVRFALQSGLMRRDAGNLDNRA
jgi:two-component system response regulator NreC